MSDTDLRALFDAWLRDRAAVHKLATLSGALLRAYGDAVSAAAVRTAYPPQVRAQSPVEAPPAAGGSFVDITTTVRCDPEWLLLRNRRLEDDTKRQRLELSRLNKALYRTKRHAKALRARLKAPPAAEQGSRPCTCHPTEAPVPCQRRYAQSECERAAKESRLQSLSAPAITHTADSPLRAPTMPEPVPAAEVSLTRDVRETWERGPLIPRRTVEHHSGTGRIERAQDDFARRPR